MNRAQCLETARAAVCVDRAAAHGAPEQTFGRIARLWTAYLRNKCPGLIDEGAELTEEDAALMQGLMKTARLQGNPGHADSWVDLAGYAACGCEIATTADGPTHEPAR